ncbi:hypothetical protein MAR_011323 [Mya arenaria]|uniref:SUEL-type lectin domain-containing protein n=1 Tax=Mya arenaria TaxID=6604 RepID=A0ABY7FWH3_MYAAR|nr:hypothetical protein MAR_011323 [Mya arenaria]
MQPGTFALGTLYKSTSSCYGVTSPVSNFMSSSCPPGEVIAIKAFTVAYKATAPNCTLDSVRNQDQFQLCCSSIEEHDCQMSYNIHPNNAVQYIDQCNGKSSCKVKATVVLLQYCIGVPDHYPNYMHINYYCIPETSIFSKATSLEQSVYLQSPGFNNGQKIPSKKNLTCSVHTCDIDSTLSIAIYQIVMENKWGQCQQKLIIRRPNRTNIGIWNCQNNTASPKTLKTSDQYLIIQLENSLTFDLGSFWLGFAVFATDTYNDHHQSNHNNGFNIYTNDADHNNYYHNKNNNRFNIYTNDDDHHSRSNIGFNINTYDDQHHSNNSNGFNIYTNDADHHNHYHHHNNNNNNRFNIYTNDDHHHSSNNYGFNVSSFDNQHHNNNSNGFSIYTNDDKHHHSNNKKFNFYTNGDEDHHHHHSNNIELNDCWTIPHFKYNGREYNINNKCRNCIQFENNNWVNTIGHINYTKT